MIPMVVLALPPLVDDDEQTTLGIDDVWPLRVYEMHLARWGGWATIRGNGRRVTVVVLEVTGPVLTHVDPARPECVGHL